MENPTVFHEIGINHGILNSGLTVECEIWTRDVKPNNEMPTFQYFVVILVHNDLSDSFERSHLIYPSLISILNVHHTILY